MIWLAGPQCSLKHEWITTETLPTDFFQNALDTSNCYQHLISSGSGKVHMRCGWRIWFMIEHSELVSLWNHVKENNTMRGKWCLKVWRNGGRHCPKKRQNKKTSCACAKLCLLERVWKPRCAKLWSIGSMDDPKYLCSWRWQHHTCSLHQSALLATWKYLPIKESSCAWMTEACPSIHRTLSTTVPFRPFHLD